MKTRTVVIALFLLAACVMHTGQQPKWYGPAHTAAGVRATLTVGGERVSGELLELRDSGLVVHAPGQVVFVPFAIIDRGTFSDSDVILKGRRVPEGDDPRKLRMLSRFPYGIPPDALHRLLVSERQDSLAVTAP